MLYLVVDTDKYKSFTLLTGVKSRKLPSKNEKTTWKFVGTFNDA